MKQYVSIAIVVLLLSSFKEMRTMQRVAALYSVSKSLGTRTFYFCDPLAIWATKQQEELKKEIKGKGQVLGSTLPEENSGVGAEPGQSVEERESQKGSRKTQSDEK